MVPRHEGSQKWLLNAIALFQESIAAAELDKAKERNESIRSTGKNLSSRRRWEIMHHHLVSIVTFEAFAEAIGVTMEEIKELVDPSSAQAC